jgi:hypothetical protein
MKIRNGFVSNSSSSSFVLRIADGVTREMGTTKSVFDVAKRMIRERDKWNEQWDREDGTKRKRENLIEKIEKAEKDGMDPNTPLMFRSCNYDSYLMRVEAPPIMTRRMRNALAASGAGGIQSTAYVVISTCNNVSWELDADSGVVPLDLIPVLRSMARIRLSSMGDRNRWYGDDPDSVSEWIQGYVRHLATFWDAENDKMVRQSVNSW